jgi:hypothetical protein
VLGHVVNADGIRQDPDKLTAVREFPPCNEGKTVALKVKKVQSYLGLCSYYRPHIKDFSIIARPLILLTKKGTAFDWGPDQESSFNNLKRALLTAQVLAHPNYDLPMGDHSRCLWLRYWCGTGTTSEGARTSVGLGQPPVKQLRNKLQHHRERMPGLVLGSKEI